MKKNFILVPALSIAIVSFVACKKDAVTAALTGTSNGSFTVRGNNYSEPAGSAYGTFAVSNNLGIVAALGLSTTNKKAIVYVGFFGTSKPAAGVYHIVSNTPVNASQVVISVFDSVSVAQQGLFSSTGTDNVSATVTVDGSGKLSVTLPTTQVSGTNIDNSNPNNTVSTTASTTLSGTIKEQ